MTDAIQGLVSEAKKNRFSSIGHNLTDEDVCSVWDNVSAFIEKQMEKQKGVSIPGLGTFTLSQKKLEVGNNKFIVTQRPVFVLAEKFAQTHGLTYTKYNTSGQIPVVQLNYSVLAFESPFDRDTVEACVREVIQAVSRSIAVKKNIDFAFTGIGRLQIRDSKVKMRFYKEFITSMDGSGKLLESMKDRPGTLDSVISNRSPTRAVSQNTLVLPKIGPAGGTAPVDVDDKAGMPTIDEEEDDRDILAERPEFHIIDTVPDPEYDAERMDNELDGMKELLAEFDVDEDLGDTKKTEQPQSRLSTRASMPLAKVTGVSLMDDILAGQLPRTPSALSKSCPKPLPKRSLSPLDHPSSAQNPRLTPLNESYDSKRSQSAEALGDGAQKSGKLPPPMPRPPSELPGSSCGHNAGQELCYLCHQRERRNIPVPLAEERRRQEEAEERTLQQYQHLKDMESILTEQERNAAKRHNDQKIAAFNLGISEAVDTKKRSRPSDFHPSFVFQNRPLTPPRFIKQDQYYKELSDQISSKYSKASKRKSDEEFLERLEQVQLAEDLAAQREQYLKDKREQQDQYKKALSAQVKTNNVTCTSPNDFAPHLRADKRIRPLSLPNPKILLPFSCMVPIRVQEGSKSQVLQVRFKPLPLPTAVPDSSEPVFGKDDMNNEAMAERRRRANELYKEQQAIVEKRKREAILRKLQEQKEAEEMLQRTRKEYVEDRSERYQRSQHIRKQLEEDWMRAAQTKGQREQEEKDHICNPGLLLMDQFEHHKRCLQCKRRLTNCGETNIWRESHYIPGSRIMV